MKENVRLIGKAMAVKARLINRHRNEMKETDSIRAYPTYSEFYGMQQAVRLLEIPFEIEWCADNVYKMAAIILDGERYEI